MSDVSLFSAFLFVVSVVFFVRYVLLTKPLKAPSARLGFSSTRVAIIPASRQSVRVLPKARQMFVLGWIFLLSGVLTELVFLFWI